MVGVIITLWLSLTSHPGITIVTLTACSEIPASDFKLLGDSHPLPTRPQTHTCESKIHYIPVSGFSSECPASPIQFHQASSRSKQMFVC